MARQKYVRFDTIGFVISADTPMLWHEHVGQLRRYCRAQIISAGLVELAHNTVHCYGESESLGIHSLPEDSQELASQLGPAWITAEQQELSKLLPNGTPD